MRKWQNIRIFRTIVATTMVATTMVATTIVATTIVATTIVATTIVATTIVATTIVATAIVATRIVVISGASREAKSTSGATARSTAVGVIALQIPSIKKVGSSSFPFARQYICNCILSC